MNYGKKGVRAKQKALNSKSQKWGRKLALTCVKIMLAAIVGIGICVEKSFQPGHEKLEREGYRVHALAKVTGIQDGKLLVED